MLLQNLRARIGARLNGDSEGGFTLIELLVVMLILGILAAIAIPAFFNQKDKATDASAKSMARSAETAMETWATENGGVYNAALPANKSWGEVFHDIEPTIDADKVTASDVTANSYVVTATSDVKEGDKNNTFSIERTSNGTTKLTCTEEGVGGCPSTGEWGG